MTLLLDTMVVTKLVGHNDHPFPARVFERVDEADDLAIGPMVFLELFHRHQKGILKPHPDSVLSHLQANIGLRVDDASFAGVATVAGSLSWTRDPFDRLIAAHAIYTDSQLLTSDRMIRANLDLAVWDEEDAR